MASILCWPQCVSESFCVFVTMGVSRRSLMLAIILPACEESFQTSLIGFFERSCGILLSHICTDAPHISGLIPSSILHFTFIELQNTVTWHAEATIRIHLSFNLICRIQLLIKLHVHISTTLNEIYVSVWILKTNCNPVSFSMVNFPLNSKQLATK